MTRPLTILSAALLLSSFAISQDIDKDAIFNGMMDNIKKIRTLSYSLDKKERIKGRMMPGAQDVKLNVSPFKAYLKVRVPNEGAEVLYIAGQNKGDAKVSPNAFPYITLNLDPDGGILRKDQHHSVKQLGFSYTGDILYYVYKKYEDKMDEYVTINGEITYDGHRCLNITLDNREYAIVPYTVRSGEDIISIARKLRLNEYQILELNGIKDFDDVKAGQSIRVPNSYCKKIEMYIDKENYLPLYQKMYDEKGLIAVYEYSNLRINPTFKAEEFTEDYKDYDF